MGENKTNFAQKQVKTSKERGGKDSSRDFIKLPPGEDKRIEIGPMLVVRSLLYMLLASCLFQFMSFWW